ncbi:hypothetical protein ACFPVY_02695 [Flavobacterium qiangtangense]|uniref:Uncharacterized protein n=1 Tax=Flavobacterium qiangtangense TaxID=1442595 RepID=A0ABW1PIU2_9FLAO
MKNKIGFNFLFAILAFPVGMALARDYYLENNSFKNPGLGVIYLVAFVGLVFWTLKKKAIRNR